MDLCLLHANCQGEPLSRLLSASPEFSARWEIRHIINYTRQEVPAAALRECSLFLYQFLDAPWNELASENLLARLPYAATSLCVPNLFFKGYWPLWTSDSSMNFGDIYLDRLLDQGLSPAEAVYVYMKDNLAERYDLKRILAESRRLERKKEQRALIGPADYVDEKWQQEQLFTTINHPAPKLTWLVANAVLKKLNLPPLPDLAEGYMPLRELSCDPEFELPINPFIGKYFGLPFADKERTYPVFGKRMNFEYYALCYADCRTKGMNLFEYLQSI